MNKQDFISKKNLEFLRSEYGQRESVAEGEAILSGRSDEEVELETLLRDHKEDHEGIYGDEVVLRDHVDEFLEYCDLLEIGLQIGFIGHALDQEYFMTLHSLLSNQYVRRYYTQYYPTFLTQGLHKRLTRYSHESVVQPPSSTAAQMHFFTFLNLTDRFYSDEEISKFLWLLDDGYDYEANGLPHFLSMLKDTQRMERDLAEGKRGEQISELIGFSKFLDYTILFDDFLESIKDDPLVQSMYYHHIRYWYAELEPWVFQLEDEVFKTIQFIWESSDKNSEEDRGASITELSVKRDRVERALENLKSDKYDQAYRAYLTN